MEKKCSSKEWWTWFNLCTFRSDKSPYEVINELPEDHAIRFLSAISKVSGCTPDHVLKQLEERINAKI